jgi:hypothetical protein
MVSSSAIRQSAPVLECTQTPMKRTSMKKFRILTLASVFALSGLMTGCFEDGSNESPTITDFRIAVSVGTDGTQSTTIDVTASTQAVVYGKYADDNAIKTVSVSFKDPTGATVNPTVSKTGAAPGGKAWNSNVDGKWVITPLTGLCNGEYTATATVTDDEGASSSATAKFTITGASTTCGGAVETIGDTTVTLGSNNNANGGSLDADEMRTYKISEVTSTAIQGKIDLYYGYSSSATADRFFTPAQAKTSDYNGIKDWTNIAAIEIYDLGTMTEAAFDAIDTETEIEAAFTGKTAESDGSVNAATGVVIGLKTSDDVMTLIRCTSINTGAAGTVQIKGKF